MNDYRLENSQGQLISLHPCYEAAHCAASSFAGPDGVVGHDGDLSDGGDRTLLWSTEASAEDDDGQRAIGSIRFEPMDF